MDFESVWQWYWGTGDADAFPETFSMASVVPLRLLVAGVLHRRFVLRHTGEEQALVPIAPIHVVPSIK